MDRVLLEKLTGSAASQEIPRIFGTRRFITVFTSARNDYYVNNNNNNHSKLAVYWALNKIMTKNFEQSKFDNKLPNKKWTS